MRPTQSHRERGRSVTAESNASHPTEVAGVGRSTRETVVTAVVAVVAAPAVVAAVTYPVAVGVVATVAAVAYVGGPPPRTASPALPIARVREGQ